MNETRITLEEYLETMAVKTYSKINGSYDHILYGNPEINQHDDKFTLGPFSEEYVNRMTWTRLYALKDDGICYTTDIASEYTSAGIAGISFKLYSNSEFAMMLGRFPAQHGWNVYLHQKGNFRSSNTIV